MALLPIINYAVQKAVNSAPAKKTLSQARQVAGNTVSYIGDKAGVPETGFSERIAGGPTKDYRNTSYASGSTDLSQYNLTPYNPANFKPISQLNQPQPTGTSGGGGGGGGGSYSEPTNTTYYDQGTGQTFGSYGDFLGTIDASYNDAYNILGQQEANIKAGEQDLYTQATAPFDAQRPVLDQALAEGNQQVEAGKEGVKKDEANAISEARRLYQELTQAGVQRFGASSSAGEFANSLLGREFQRNVGKAFDTAGQNIQKLVEKGIQIKQNYDTQLQSLETQKTAALSQARDVFRQRLDQINNTRLGLSENKAQLKLQALQQLRSEAMAISQQHEQFRQQLILNSQTADLNLKSAIAQYRAQNGQPVQQNQFANSAYSQFSNTGTGTNIGAYQGGVTTQKRSPYDSPFLS